MINTQWQLCKNKLTLGLGQLTKKLIKHPSSVSCDVDWVSNQGLIKVTNGVLIKDAFSKHNPRPVYLLVAQLLQSQLYWQCWLSMPFLWSTHFTWFNLIIIFLQDLFDFWRLLYYIDYREKKVSLPFKLINLQEIDTDLSYEIQDKSFF